MQCCVDNDTVRRLGVTFDQFVCLGRCNGAVVDAHRASNVTLQQFRATVSAICGQQPMEKSSFLVSRCVYTYISLSFSLFSLSVFQALTLQLQLQPRDVRPDGRRALVASRRLSR
jgi:hypothetical protein